MKKHLGVYLRVSTQQQDHRSQVSDLERWLEAFANERPVVWYRDKQSGKSMDRPGWQKLESAIDAGQVEAVVCWRLDRLGRTASGLTNLFDKLTARRVNLISLRDGVDLGTPAGRMLAGVLASIAQFENEVRSERVRAGQDAARAAGKRWGGSKPGRRLKVTDEAVATIERMAAEGASKTAMARATGLSRPTVYAVLGSQQ
jgi:DNA invertase Pin-like site-specific DNA recombinase